MSNNGMTLGDGTRIAVVGGGPAGSFFASFLLKGARRKGLKLDLTILDGKDFEEKGPRGCNMCAGVISQSLVSFLQAEGFEIPEEKVQASIDGYRCITREEEYTFHLPDERSKILSVFRGNGPRFCHDRGSVSFDELLLQRAVNLGAQVVPEPVREILPGPSMRVVHGGPDGLTTLEVDLVVVATGLNTRIIEALQKADIGYRPPVTTRACQAEIPLPREVLRERFGRLVTVFSLGLRHIRFGAFTPKKDFLSLTLVGNRDLDRCDMDEFLADHRVRSLFPDDWEPPKQLCVCYPRVATRPARQPFGDRLVVIGDAAANRYYKNGIESAFRGAQVAADTVLRRGYSRAAFDKEYRRFIRATGWDNLMGRIVYWLNDRVSRRRFMRQAQMRAILDYKNRPISQQINKIQWSIFTGNEPYWKILLKLLAPAIQWRLLLTTMRVFAGQAARRTRGLLGKGRDQLITGAYGPLEDGQRVAIIGGGPAGVSCAIALKRQARLLGRRVEVLLYEAKDFNGGLQYNQCAGVLSPPLRQLMEEELEVPFPDHLIQRRISGYRLSSNRRELRLEGEDDDTVAVRRIAFDRFFFNEARARGVRTLHTRVTGIEIHPDKVQIYSKSDSRAVDVVVGAFGLDDGSCQIFEHSTPFRQPQFLESIVTKIHPGEDFMEQFGDAIRAFLPPIPAVEFGAMTPKGNHLTINIAGRRVTMDDMHEFLGYGPVQQALPQQPSFDGFFKGKFPDGPGQKLYGDRYLVIGDAAGLLRPFKGKGVTAACKTGIVAAETIMRRGISEGALEEFYRSMDEVTKDMFYGKVLRQVAIRSANMDLMDSLLDLGARDEEMKKALFYSVSGLKSYRRIVREHMSPTLMARAGLSMLAWRLCDQTDSK